MRQGEELAIQAMKKEFKRLSKVAERAKKETDEHINIGSEILGIHKEFSDIVNAKESTKETALKLNALIKRSERATKIRKKSLLELIEKQSKSEIERDNLLIELQNAEFRFSRYAATKP